jgi:hypothetical protein
VWRALPVGGAPAPEIAAVSPVRPRRWGRWAVNGVGLVVLAGMTAAPTAALAWTQRHADFASFARRVKATIPVGAGVMGNVMFWSVLHDRQFIASFPPDFALDWPDEQAAAAHIRKYRPEYLIQESLLYQTTKMSGAAPTDLRRLAFGRACELVTAEVPSEILLDEQDYDYGAVRVWRLHWPTPAAEGIAASRPTVMRP